MCHAAKTIRRNLDWRDEESIFLSGLTVNAKAHHTHLPPPPHPLPTSPTPYPLSLPFFPLKAESRKLSEIIFLILSLQIQNNY